MPIAGLSLRRTGFDLGPFHVRFEADKVAMVQICSEFFGFCLSVVFHKCSIFILLSEKQACQPSGRKAIGQNKVTAA